MVLQPRVALCKVWGGKPAKIPCMLILPQPGQPRAETASGCT